MSLFKNALLENWNRVHSVLAEQKRSDQLLRRLGYLAVQSMRNVAAMMRQCREQIFDSIKMHTYYGSIGDFIHNAKTLLVRLQKRSSVGTPRSISSSLQHREIYNPFNDTFSGEVNTTSWNFGLGHNVGFGYRVGPFSLIPFNQNQLVFSGSRFWYSDSLAQTEIDMLTRLEGDIRFGVSTEGGAEFYVAETIALKGSFEGQVQDRTWSFTVAVDFVPRSVEAHGKNLPGTMWEFDKDRNEVKIQPLPGPVDIVIA